MIGNSEYVWTKNDNTFLELPPETRGSPKSLDRLNEARFGNFAVISRIKGQLQFFIRDIHGDFRCCPFERNAGHASLIRTPFLIDPETWYYQAGN